MVERIIVYKNVTDTLASYLFSFPNLHDVVLSVLSVATPWVASSGFRYSENPKRALYIISVVIVFTAMVGYKEVGSFCFCQSVTHAIRNRRGGEENLEDQRVKKKAPRNDL